MLRYQFPAVKGKQAGKEYYICMVPLGLLSKIFMTDNNDVASEHRAQRRLKTRTETGTTFIFPPDWTGCRIRI